MRVRDDELVAAARSGDTEAFAELVSRHRAWVEAVLARMVGGDAEDVVQEALLRSYLGLSQLRDPSSFGGWLCGIAVNLAKMRIRRRALEEQATAERPHEPGSDDRELLELVTQAVDVLPPGQREAVLMHYVDDLSCEEIASLLGVSPGAVRVRLHRARAQLREELAVLAPTPRRKEIPMIEMKLEDVVVRVAEDDPSRLVAPQRIVLLKEMDGNRLLCIWVGPPEGDTLAMRLTGWTMPRPMTSDLMADLVRAMGARVEKVVVSRLEEKTFYALVVLADAGQVAELDARPSDALNLAARLGAGIFVAEDVLAEKATVLTDMATYLETEAGRADTELPAGQWRSLSGELLETLYPAP